MTDWKYNDCGDPPHPDAWDWATKSVPSEKQWVGNVAKQNKLVFAVGALTGSGLIYYAGYRIARLSLSAIPGLQWTIWWNLTAW